MLKSEKVGMNDGRIIALFNKRDEAAVEAVRQKFGGLCRSLISNVLSDERDVEECLSSVYYKLWSSIPPASPKDLTAYVAKTARNEALSRYRANTAKRNLAVTVTLEELKNSLASNENAEDELDAKAIAKAVEGFVLRLPPLQRKVFMRRYWFFDSLNDIAKLSGVSEERVEQLLARTRRELRRYLIKEEYIYE